MTDHMNTVDTEIYGRIGIVNCFKTTKHSVHVWGGRDAHGSPKTFWCEGVGARPDAFEEGSDSPQPVDTWANRLHVHNKAIRESITTQDAADELLASRRAVYGDRADSMRRTAKVWSGLTGYDIQPWMVPLMMSAYKMLRAFGAPDYSDNIDDVDGWNKMFREQMESDGTPIIQARTVEEYLEKKADRGE